MNKYLIIQKSKNKIYCFIEDDNNHLINESLRISEKNIRLPIYKLDDECEINSYDDGSYFVLELK